MNISSAIFDCSAPDLDSCPDESLPEFAFIGRSNVGKSSLLNMLAGKRGLARVSTTPGYTKLINIFTINRTWRLVDLPGYGYAHLARKEMAQFNQAVFHYLQHRPNLGCVFALIDSGLPPQEIDLEFVEWLAINSVPFVLVFTKSDRVPLVEVRKNIELFKKCLMEMFGNLPEIFTCSATKKQGRGDLLGLIEKTMAEETMAAERTDPDRQRSDAEVSIEGLPSTGSKTTTPAPRKKRPNPARPW